LDFKQTNFVSVGVGPVSLDPRFVTKGTPMKGLLVDMTFLAQQMGVTMPPIMSSTHTEYWYFVQYLTKEPNPGTKTFEAMAAESLAMADGQHKFPKLPSHW
jgi:hypothetical protein